MLHPPLGELLTDDASRVVSLLQRLTDVPRERALAVIGNLPAAERGRLDSLAAEILQEHSNLSHS